MKATKAKPHAVRSLSNGSTFQYDLNGNMTQRVEVSGTQRITYTQGWDVENRLVAVTKTVTTSVQVSNFYYDADGKRVKRVDVSGTVAYVEPHYEVNTTTGITTSYYYFGSQRVAMRQGNAVWWLHGDHPSLRSGQAWVAPT